MKRIHLNTETKIDKFGDSILITSVLTGNGTYRGIFDVEDDGIEFVEECLDADENVVKYSTENLN